MFNRYIGSAFAETLFFMIRLIDWSSWLIRWKNDFTIVWSQISDLGVPRKRFRVSAFTPCNPEHWVGHTARSRSIYLSCTLRKDSELKYTLFSRRFQWIYLFSRENDPYHDSRIGRKEDFKRQTRILISTFSAVLYYSIHMT